MRFITKLVQQCNVCAWRAITHNYNFHTKPTFIMTLFAFRVFAFIITIVSMLSLVYLGDKTPFFLFCKAQGTSFGE